jgi:hypothetical protein
MTRTNRWTTVALLIAVAGTLPAQAPTTLGLTGGINLASVSGSDDDPSSRTGFRVGAFMTRAIAPAVSLQPELVFTSKGAAFETADLVINYIQIPVLIRVELPSATGSTVPYALIGPAMAFKVGCDIQADNGQSVECGPGSTDVTGTDISIILGAGLQFGAVGASLRYDLGVSNINEGVNEVSSQTITIEFSYAIQRR